jgi:hypothetical protein
MRLYIENDLKCRLYKEHINWSVYFETDNGRLNFQLAFDIIPTPHRYERILIDRYHNLFYPFDGLIPRDDLLDRRYNYDWTNESFLGNYFGVLLFNVGDKLPQTNSLLC